jgi:hypothetical protein
MSTRQSHRKTPAVSAATNLLGAIINRAETANNEQSLPEMRVVQGLPSIPIWDELIALYTNCLQGLQMYTGISGLKDRRDLFEAMSPASRGRYIATMTQFSQDLKAYDQDLTAIRNLHAGKTGGENDYQLVMQSIQISEQYENFKVQAESVLTQSYLQLVELIQEAEATLAAQNNDVNLITDVVSVEVIETAST